MGCAYSLRINLKTWKQIKVVYVHFVIIVPRKHVSKKFSDNITKPFSLFLKTENQFLRTEPNNLLLSHTNLFRIFYL